MRKQVFLTLSILLLAIVQPATAQKQLSYYLPTDVSYDSTIPTPESVIGHQVGEFHITHDRLVSYMYAIAEASDRITIEKTGETHERRPQLLLTITSPENHGNLSSLKEQHKALSDPSKSGSIDIANVPAVVWQGYSIHGNEPSGSNASMLAVYYYAAAQGEEIDQILDQLIILVDPSFNPDGLTRFSTWANSRRSKNLVADPNNLEQSEYWPGGRTNHYWFDLNRDWLPVQQPEARNRIVKYHEWKPNILTDHHEMGTSSTFFFQPGIPSRNNPNTPKENFELTTRIGNFHAIALDSIGSLYFTKESYDDFYYGKGSTFPDINGGVGILFEQASSRGHAQESQHGLLEFPFTIRNQFTASLSTVAAAVAMKDELLDYQKRFFTDAKGEAARNTNKAIIFGSQNDRSRVKALADILVMHEIEVKWLKNDARLGTNKYPAGSSMVVSLNQPQYRLINAMFEEVTSFQDSLFYDVSAWTLPHAFNLSFDYLSAKSLTTIKSGESYGKEKATAIPVNASDYAYAFEWDDYYAPKMLNRLLNEGILCKVANDPFSAAGKSFDRGSIMIPVSLQSMSTSELLNTLSGLSSEFDIAISALPTGLTMGVNLGSRTLSTVEKPSIAILAEGGSRSNDVGEVWHLLDNRFDMQVTLLPIRNLEQADLNRYKTIIMVDGNYGNATSMEKLKTWIKNGGNLIAYKRANNWLKQAEIIKLEFVKSEKDTGSPKSYATMDETRGAQLTAGTIFTGNLDVTHPLAYGYNTTSLPAFVNTNGFFEAPENPYAYPFQFDEREPLLSGYVHPDNLKRIKGSPGIIVSRYGTGQVVSFAFNTNFRAFWYGTNKLLLNAIFFGSEISSRSKAE